MTMFNRCCYNVNDLNQWIGWERCVLLQTMGLVQDSEWKTYGRDRVDSWNLDGMVQTQYDENKLETMKFETVERS